VTDVEKVVEVVALNVALFDLLFEGPTGPVIPVWPV
jgi:hypothetical protein